MSSDILVSQLPNQGILEESSDTESLVVFRIDAEYYAVPIASIEGIIKIPPVTVVPNSPPYIQGIITVRGRVVTVVDLEKRFALPRESNLTQQHLLLVTVHDVSVGVIVDKALGVLRVLRTQIAEPPTALTTKFGAQILRGIYVVPESGTSEIAGEHGDDTVPAGKPQRSGVHFGITPSSLVLILNIDAFIVDLVEVPASAPSPDEVVGKL